MKRRKHIYGNSGKQPEPSSYPPGTLGRDVQTKIGDQLRALHDDIVKQGVPDRFVELLARFDRAKNREGE
jgi:hypothetical protein